MQPSLNFLYLCMGVIGFGVVIIVIVYQGYRLVDFINYIKETRILPVTLYDTDDHEIEIPRVTFQVDATEITYSDNEDAIYVEAYRDNLVSKPIIVELTAEIIESDDDIQPIAIAVIK